MKKARILVVDDEQSIADMVEIIFNKEGFSNVDVCYSAAEAESLLFKNRYALHVVDVMLPDKTGYELASIIRRISKAPIFFLSAKTSDADKLRGFIHGADDYITKPFNPLELVARAKVQLNRYLDSPTDKKTVYEFGRFQLDANAAELVVEGEVVPLTNKLYHLLLLFCEHPGQVFSKDQLYERVWGDSSFMDDNTIMVHIRKIREKIEKDPSKPEYLKTVRGIGYKLVTGEKK
ncbi:response regulator transcription factor [Lederbergia citrisecunda]|uniref:response regulator transcription factor n=1 Tax=Lederbergia citrisecunda TaxID=2833583 RepID=UPI003D2A50C0